MKCEDVFIDVKVFEILCFDIEILYRERDDAEVRVVEFLSFIECLNDEGIEFELGYDVEYDENDNIHRYILILVYNEDDGIKVSEILKRYKTIKDDVQIVLVE